MKPLKLEDANKARVVQCNTQSFANTLHEARCGTRLTYYFVECDNAKNKAQLLSLLKNTLKFPDYFDSSWDGLYEVLCDEKVIPENGVFLCLAHTDVFKRHAPHEWENFHNALSEAIDYWRAADVPFWVFLDDSHAK